MVTATATSVKQVSDSTQRDSLKNCSKEHGEGAIRPAAATRIHLPEVHLTRALREAPERGVERPSAASNARARRELSARGRDGRARQARVTYSTIVATANPVPPLGCDGRALETDAGPAMSTCTHGVSLANVFRNRPAVMAPPYRSPVLRMSATELFSCSRSRLFSGRRHMSSPVRS